MFAALFLYLFIDIYNFYFTFLKYTTIQKFGVTDAFLL